VLFGNLQDYLRGDTILKNEKNDDGKEASSEPPILFFDLSDDKRHNTDISHCLRLERRIAPSALPDIVI
jgi:hypothetical protein